jgi:cyclophilin family peptidyl-prolyl cis-trans isomerase/HEAT repeat protein
MPRPGPERRSSRVHFLLLAALLGAACRSAADDPRVKAADLADRRVGRPDAWDELLMRSDAATRQAAARAAGRVREVRLSGVVARAYEIETDDAVRAEQLFALGQIGDPASATLLLAQLDVNVPELRAAAAEAVGKLNVAHTASTLVSHLLDPAAEVRGAALLALARLAGRRNATRDALDPEAQSAFLRDAQALLEDADPAVRWKAAYALAEIDMPGRATALRHALESSDATTRFFALGGLARLVAEKEAVAADFAGSLADADPFVAAQAATGLGKCGDERAVAPLLARLGDRGAPARWHVRRAAIAALAEIAGKLDPKSSTRADVLHACRQATEFETLSVAAAALEAVFTLSAGEGRDAIAEFEPSWGGSRSPYVRVAFVRALSSAPWDGASERLFKLTHDANPYVASEAYTALATFAKPPLDAARRARLRDAALAGVNARDFAIAANALDLLKVCGEADDLALVDDVYARFPGDEAAEARGGAVHVAAALAGAKAEPLLRDAALDPSPSVRAAAHAEYKRLALAEAAAPLPPLEGRPVAASDGGDRPSSPELEAGVDLLSTEPNPRIVLRFGARGDVVIELLREEAPHHVKMALERVRAGRCDGLPIHRVVSGFVVQGLDPRGDGWGTGDVFLRDEIGRVPYLRGTLGMPNAGPDSGGCQIFVTLEPTPHLDGRYTVFGRVVGGMDVVDALDVSDVCTQAEVIP